MLDRREWLGLAVFLALSFSAAALGGLAMRGGPGAWYEALAKPTWTPPGWLFGPVWTLLYTLMAVAAWLVWREAGLSGARWALGLFALQLVLNAAWTPLFFGLHRPGWAFAEICALFIAITATTAAFFARSPAAGTLMLPYLGWVGFAAALNFAIWRLNG
jgi:tryptophan-rich sensory protein